MFTPAVEFTDRARPTTRPPARVDFTAPAVQEIDPPVGARLGDEDEPEPDQVEPGLTGPMGLWTFPVISGIVLARRGDPIDQVAEEDLPESADIGSLGKLRTPILENRVAIAPQATGLGVSSGAAKAGHVETEEGLPQHIF